MTNRELELLAEIARLRAEIDAYRMTLDEIASSTECKRARALAWGVLGDWDENRGAA